MRTWLARAGAAYQLLLTIAAGALWLALTAYFGKFSVRVAGLPAVVWVLLIAAAIGAVLVSTRWFRHPTYRSAPVLTIVLVFGYLLVALVGLTRGNPPRADRAGVPIANVPATSGAIEDGALLGLDLLSGVEVDSEDGLALAILLCSVIGLLIAALMIPNFWVVGLGVLFLLLALVTWRDARVPSARV